MSMICRSRRLRGSSNRAGIGIESSQVYAKFLTGLRMMSRAGAKNLAGPNHERRETTKMGTPRRKGGRAMLYEDQVLERLRTICLALPEAREVTAWGHPTFRVNNKIFAGFGENEGLLSITVKATFAEQEELLKDERFYVPPYVGKHG